jgi:hypothetical protein
VYLDDMIRARLMGLAATPDSRAGLFDPADSMAGLLSPDKSVDGLRPPPRMRGAYTVGAPPPRITKDWRRCMGALMFAPCGALVEDTHDVVPTSDGDCLLGECGSRCGMSLEEPREDEWRPAGCLGR